MESGEWRNFLFRNLSGTAGFELVSKKFETGFSVFIGENTMFIVKHRYIRFVFAK